MILTEKNTNSDFQLFGGGKAKHLAILSTSQVPVPEWFCIGAPVFEHYLNAHDLQSKLIPKKDLATFANEIEALFISHDLPVEISEQIQKELSTRNWNEQFLAVRSSGLDEDSKNHSFAGLFSSFLFQSGWQNVSESIRRCWASAYSERALAYRVDRGLSISRPQMGVVIQKMVNADVAGVFFTRNPIQPLDRESLIIDSVWGLGEGLVSGELDADHFKLKRSTNEVITKKIISKTHAMRIGKLKDGKQRGLQKEVVAKELQEVASLTQTQLSELAALGLRLEGIQNNQPQDIEWAFEKGKLYLLQMRPVTSLPDEAFYDPKVNGSEANLWDNSNIIESFSGVTSPFTFSFASYAYQVVYRQFAEMMNVPESIILENETRFRNMLGLVRGRIYYNLVNWYRLLMTMPGSASNPAFMETMMGVKKSLTAEHQKIFDFMKQAPTYSAWFKLKLLIMSIYRYLWSDSIIRGFKTRFNAIYEKARTQNFRELSLQEQLSYYQYLQDGILLHWQAPIVNDFLCMIFFGSLKKLTAKWVQDGDAGASLQNDLLCGQGDLESTEPTKQLMRIAKIIDAGDSAFREWYTTHPSDEVWKALPTQDLKVHALFMDFLSKYGFRCVNELKLEERDLHDDPSFVIGVVSSYVRMKSYSIEAMAEREQKIKAAADAVVRAKVRGVKSLFYFWVLGQARKAVKNREDLRFDRTKIYGIVRHLICAMGENFVKLGLLETERDVFYLTIEELTAFIEGRSPTHDLSSMVLARRAIYDEYRKTPASPDRFVTYGAVGMSLRYPQVLMDGDLLADQVLRSDDPNLLYGTPCCPGVVEGVVRVAHELKDTDGLAGEILVTSRTDPGWVPLYPSCSGLLIERGSLLSHSAVVARELGLPTIVGISGGLMTKLKTGQRVRIDAGKGEVRIL